MKIEAEIKFRKAEKDFLLANGNFVIADNDFLMADGKFVRNNAPNTIKNALKINSPAFWGGAVSVCRIGVS